MSTKFVKPRGTNFSGATPDVARQTVRPSSSINTSTTIKVVNVLVSCRPKIGPMIGIWLFDRGSAGKEMAGSPTPNPAFGKAKNGSHTHTIAVNSTRPPNNKNPRRIGALMDASLLRQIGDG